MVRPGPPQLPKYEHKWFLITRECPCCSKTRKQQILRKCCFLGIRELLWLILTLQWRESGSERWQMRIRCNSHVASKGLSQDVQTWETRVSIGLYCWNILVCRSRNKIIIDEAGYVYLKIHTSYLITHSIKTQFYFSLYHPVIITIHNDKLR